MTEGSRDIRYGARVFSLDDGRILVKQTVKSGQDPNDRFVIDAHRERHIDWQDDRAIAAAIRDALRGSLSQ